MLAIIRYFIRKVSEF